MRRRAGACLALACLAGACLAGACLLVALPLGAQTTGTVAIDGPLGSPLREATPRFTITTSGFTAAEMPLRLTLQISTRADFTGPLLVDTTIVAATFTTIVTAKLLPERISIWWRARVLNAQNQPVLSNAIGPRTTATWLTLLSPNNQNVSTVSSRRPTFLWTSATARPPAGPWSYQLFITRSVDGRPVPVLRDSPLDTVYTSVFDLESNTPYRWSVIARSAAGDSTKADSFTSFVILDPNAPAATVLYPPFPNPFPNARVSAICIWFDLRALSEVRIDVLDIRGNHVARIMPGRGLGPLIPPSRYGRAAVGSDSGCDDRLTWNGTDDGGRTVPMGIYLVRFRGDGVTTTKKVVWKGR